jgi:hypothetical protein
MHKQEKQIPIWFFIGATLSVYGLLIFGTGIYHLVSPPEQPVAMAYLHADIWWGALLTIIGLIYVLKYRPSKEDSAR